MSALAFAYGYVGPALFLLLPVSMTACFLTFYVFCCVGTQRQVSDWAEVVLAHLKETATLVGLLGSVYALTSSFKANGASVEEIRNNMFLILSTGFWSTIVGVLVSLEASLGLLALKRT